VVIAVVGWFGALLTGRLPAFAEDFLAGVVRWTTRVRGYLHFLTDDYPPFTLDVEEGYPVRIAIPPPTELNRLAVLFRIIIAIPAIIVVNVVSSGLSLLSIASWATIRVHRRHAPSAVRGDHGGHPLRDALLRLLLHAGARVPVGTVRRRPRRRAGLTLARADAG
jgi:hypothetical protein